MARQLDAVVTKTLKDHGFGKDAVWDCHGTWVVYHRVLEQIASKIGIKFDAPQVLEADGKNHSVALCVAGRLKDKSEWSVGEASPGNNKNAYPYAMAEKRAKDRVILKLIGLHGLVYSEDEADDFKAEWRGPLNKTALKEKMRAFSAALTEAANLNAVNDIVNNYRQVLEQCERDLPDWYFGNADSNGAQAAIAEKLSELEKRA